MLQAHRVLIFLSSHVLSDVNLCQVEGGAESGPLGARLLTAWSDSDAGMPGGMALQATGSLRVLLVLRKEVTFHPLTAFHWQLKSLYSVLLPKR